MIGKLFGEKRLDFSKRVALTGEGIKKQGYLSILQGASIENVLVDNLATDHGRIISGNILNGKKIDKTGYVGFYHHQLTVIPEGGERRFMGWMEPGFKHWSFSHTYLSWLFPRKMYQFDTSLNGGVRPVMFNTYYDKVFPFDIMPVQLLKACIAEEVELMENLGIYEVTEEDFALCEVICPSKIEWQEIILKGLTLLKG
ncbi:MAG: hypothetical protein LBU51_05580 [Bacteroidales bacterium]|jgi:Na+-transporting NADH:ubiquinone oxidoreductase subunit A|nr:hypothetical protein [Bacteroidales bacterium]